MLERVSLLCCVVLCHVVLMYNMLWLCNLTCNDSTTTLSGVVVAHRGISWWVAELGPHWTVPCSWQGQPLACEYVSTSHAGGNDTAQALLRRAQAVVHEGCRDPAAVPVQYQDKLQVMFNMEPHTATTQCGQLDYAGMTYRSSSQV